MTSNTAYWSLCIGRWRGVEIRIHAFLVLALLAAMLLTREPEGVEVRLVCWSFIILVTSVTSYELVRILTAQRVGGQVKSLVLGPVGGLSQIQVPADPPAVLLTGIVGPGFLFLTVMLFACGLTLAGDRDVLRLVVNPLSPKIMYPHVGLQEIGFEQLAQLSVWINSFLLMIALLPVEPCAGSEIIRGFLWPLVGRNTAQTATSHIALGMSVFFASLAVWMASSRDVEGTLPSWFPLAATSVYLLFAARNGSSTRRFDAGIAIDQFDSDDEDWLARGMVEEDREAVLVEHLQDKQQEALDRKRREREANEDARVDAILARLHGSSFAALSEEERAFLKRASRRYQRRRGTTGDNHAES